MSTKSVKKIKIQKRNPAAPKKISYPKKKPEFKAKKVVTKVEYADICTIPAIQRDIAGTISTAAFPYIADHCVSKINEVTGRVPKTTESFSYGRLVHYLWRCHAAYQLRAGTFVGDVANHQEYLNFAIPGYVACLFENSCVFTDDRTGARIRLQDNNYDANMHALIVNEGSVRNQVWDGTAALNEPVFTNGVPVGYADLTLANSRELSDLISKSFKHIVFVRDVRDHSSRLNDLIGLNNSAVKPLSLPQVKLTLATYSAPIYPCEFVVSSATNWLGNLTVKALQYICEDYLYVPGRTINKMISSLGFNPYRFNARSIEINAAAFSALVATVVKETGAISPLSDGLTCWRAYVNNYIYMFCSYFSRFSWLSRSALSTATPPTYINDSMKAMFIPPVAAMIGTKPAIHGDTIVVPYFSYELNTSALMSQWQSSTNVNASNSVQFGLGSAVYGAINTPMTYFANVSPYPAAIKYNFAPLNVLDSLTSYAATNAWNTVEPAYARVDVGAKICDCLTQLTFSTDTFLASQVVGNSFAINWMENKILLSDCFVDQMGCVCAKGTSLFTLGNTDTLAAHAELVYTNTGEPTTLVVQSGIRDGTFDNMFAAMQNKDLGKAIMSFFKSKMAQSFHQESIVVSSANFVDMVKRVASQDLALPPAPEDWISRIANSNIGQAVLTSAAAVATYGPKAYQALRQLTDITVRAAA